MQLRAGGVAGGQRLAAGQSSPPSHMSRSSSGVVGNQCG